MARHTESKNSARSVGMERVNQPRYKHRQLNTGSSTHETHETHKAHKTCKAQHRTNNKQGDTERESREVGEDKESGRET